MKYKLILTDIDGVWTDGGMYYDQTGNEWKKFNTTDSVGVVFLRHLNIPVGIITGEDTEIVKRRAEKLKIDHLYLGIKNKLAVFKELCEKLNISPEEVAYIGDNINDIPLLKAVGFSACPSNAPYYVQKFADVTIPTQGGDGAFKDFVEYILEENNLLEKALELYLETIS